MAVEQFTLNIFMRRCTVHMYKIHV